MGTLILYTVTDDEGNAIVKDVEAREGAKIVGTSRNYFQRCASGGIKYNGKYTITAKEKELTKETASVYERLTKSLSDEWDATMYAARKKQGLDTKYLEEYADKKGISLDALVEEVKARSNEK